MGSRPSGTLATISPIEKVIAAAQPRPAASPTGTNATATAAMIQVTRRTCRSSGLGRVRPRCDSAAMRPSSVCMPVRVTTVAGLPLGSVGNQRAQHAPCPVTLARPPLARDTV